MQTEKQIRELLKSKIKVEKETSKRFLKYDDADDMHYLDVLEAEIALLREILK